MPRQRKVSLLDKAHFDALLASYPRSRPALSPEYEAIFVDHYQRNRRSDGGLSRLVCALEAWMHRRVARDGGVGSILEIGAGTLNHLQYEKQARCYDVVEPFRDLWQDSPVRASVGQIYEDVEDIPAVAKYDRIISVAVLEHLTDLPGVLARCALLLNPGGLFQAGIPSEGGLLWTFGWKSTTGVAFRITRGLAYEPIMRHEHINTAVEIEALVGYFFGGVKIERFPFQSRHLSFYTYIRASEPRIKDAAALLDQQAARRRGVD